MRYLQTALELSVLKNKGASEMARLAGLIFLSFLLLVNYAFASSSDYKCKIDRVSVSKYDVSEGLDAVLNSYIGEEFTVERNSGIMAGALKNSYVTKPQVIDSGSNENSYKVIASLKVSEGAGRGSNIYALTIDEFESGQNKPFVFLRNNQVFFGFCTHFL